jgi:hypothetical protein
MMQMWRTIGALGVGLVVAGCSSAPDVPFGVRATETVWCADADGVVDTVTWQGHDGPLTGLDVQVVALGAGAVSEDDLLDACAGRFRWLTGATVCEAYADVESLERFATTEFVFERYGEPGPDGPGFPVVVRDRTSCADVELDAGPAAAVAAAGDRPIADRLRDWDTSQRFNDWRAREAAWRDAADGGCLDLGQAREHALAAQAELDGDWPVFETAHDPEDPTHAGLCLDVRLQREGFIEISYHAVETTQGRPGAVEDVTDIVEPDSPAGG